MVLDAPLRETAEDRQDLEDAGVGRGAAHAVGADEIAAIPGPQTHPVRIDHVQLPQVTVDSVRQYRLLQTVALVHALLKLGGDPGGELDQGVLVRVAALDLDVDEQRRHVGHGCRLVDAWRGAFRVLPPLEGEALGRGEIEPDGVVDLFVEVLEQLARVLTERPWRDFNAVLHSRHHEPWNLAFVFAKPLTSLGPLIRIGCLGYRIATTFG